MVNVKNKLVIISSHMEELQTLLNISQYLDDVQQKAYIAAAKLMQIFADYESKSKFESLEQLNTLSYLIIENDAKATIANLKESILSKTNKILGKQIPLEDSNMFKQKFREYILDNGKNLGIKIQNKIDALKELGFDISVSESMKYICKICTKIENDNSNLAQNIITQFNTICEYNASLDSQISSFTEKNKILSECSTQLNTLNKLFKQIHIDHQHVTGLEMPTVSSTVDEIKIYSTKLQAYFNNYSGTLQDIIQLLLDQKSKETECNVSPYAFSPKKIEQLYINPKTILTDIIDSHVQFLNQCQSKIQAYKSLADETNIQLDEYNAIIDRINNEFNIEIAKLEKLQIPNQSQDIQSLQSIITNLNFNKLDELDTISNVLHKLIELPSTAQVSATQFIDQVHLKYSQENTTMQTLYHNIDKFVKELNAISVSEIENYPLWMTTSESSKENIIDKALPISIFDTTVSTLDLETHRKIQEDLRINISKLNTTLKLIENYKQLSLLTHEQKDQLKSLLTNQFLLNYGSLSGIISYNNLVVKINSYIESKSHEKEYIQHINRNIEMINTSWAAISLDPNWITTLDGRIDKLLTVSSKAVELIATIDGLSLMFSWKSSSTSKQSFVNDLIREANNHFSLHLDLVKKNRRDPNDLNEFINTFNNYLRPVQELSSYEYPTGLINDESIQSYEKFTDTLTDFAQKYILLIDSMHAVRLILNNRTIWTGHDSGKTELAQKNYIKLYRINEEEGNTYSRKLHPLIFNDKNHGPYYMVLHNGDGLNAKTDVALLNDRARTNTMHTIYTAYGYSGSGKTHTLMNTLISSLCDELAKTKFNIKISFYDLYGEIDDTKGDQINPCTNQYGTLRGRRIVEFVTHFDEHGVCQPNTHLIPITNLSEMKSTIIEACRKITTTRNTNLAALHYPQHSAEDPDIFDEIELPLIPTRTAHPCMYHIRSTPNNEESSRSQFFIDMYVYDQDRFVGRFTIVDMGGSEKVDIIQKMYFAPTSIKNEKVIVKPVTFKNTTIFHDISPLAGSFQSTGGGGIVKWYNQFKDMIQIEALPGEPATILQYAAWSNLYSQLDHRNDIEASAVMKLLQNNDPAVIMSKLMKLQFKVADILLAIKTAFTDISESDYDTFRKLGQSEQTTMTKAWMTKAAKLSELKNKTSVNKIKTNWGGNTTAWQTINKVILNHAQKLANIRSEQQALQVEFDNVLKQQRSHSIKDGEVLDRIRHCMNPPSSTRIDVALAVDTPNLSSYLDKVITDCNEIVRRHHCPVRNQGTYIEHSLTDLQKFSQLLYKNDLNVYETHYKTQIVKCFKNAQNTKQKLVVLSNVRLDFDVSELKPRSGDPPLVDHLAEAFLGTIEFSSKINPLEGTFVQQ